MLPLLPLMLQPGWTAPGIPCVGTGRAALKLCAASTPSLDVLRERLENRGTEDDDEVERRLRRAREEIEFAVTSRCFDKTIVNDDVERAYAELSALVAEVLAEGGEAAEAEAAAEVQEGA